MNFSLNDGPPSVRIARAMLEYLAGPGIIDGEPRRLTFAMWTDADEVMRQICVRAGWRPKRWTDRQRMFNSVASKLESMQYLRRVDCLERDSGNTKLESFAPICVYELPLRYRVRLNPTIWTGHALKWSPEREMENILLRVFDDRIRKINRLQ